jgi:hypothetical protein
MFKFCFFERITVIVITARHIENFPRWEYSAGAINPLTPGSVRLWPIAVSFLGAQTFRRSRACAPLTHLSSRFKFSAPPVAATSTLGVSVNVTALRTSKIYRSMLQRFRRLIRRCYFGKRNRFATARTIDDEVPLSRLGRRHLARLLFGPDLFA